MMKKQQSLGYFLLLVALIWAEAGGEEKEGKFSIFSVIRFPNKQCVAVSDATMMGTCMTSGECDSASGSNDGNCASGFGVCCVFYSKTCGNVDVVHNCTYITNPSFPTVNNEMGQTCIYNVKSTGFNEAICQLRLDFDTVRLAQPADASGKCSADTFVVTSPTSASPRAMPTLCGTLTGSHMYVETARRENAASIKVAIGTSVFSRIWKIKVTYIDCFSPVRAPTDCLQYFTGVSGYVQSYGWNTGAKFIAPQLYASCFRQELGYCALDFGADSDGANPDYFNLLKPGSTGANAMRTAGSCDSNRISFVPSLTERTAVASSPTAMKNGGASFCGNQFNIIGGATKPGTVRTTTLPFRLTTLAVPTAADAVATGYKLSFRMVPC